MDTSIHKHHIPPSSVVLKSHVNRYALIGLMISLVSIVVATFLVAYQMTGEITLGSLLLAQTSNPAIWALDLTPFMFAYWGQAFCYGLADKAESILEDKEREYKSKSSDLKLKLEYETNHDSLTQLPNRRLITEKIDQLISQVPSSSLAVIIININDFKNINYNVGVFNANHILKQFAEKLKSILLEPFLLRACMGMNLVAHLQADEFAIMLPRLNPEISLKTAIQNINDLTSTDYMVDGLNIHIATTIGVAVYPEHGRNAEELIHHANVSAYNARKEGKNFAIYDAKMNEDYTHNRILLAELENALENDKLEVHYLPFFDIASRKIVGTEASIQFYSPKLGKVNSERIVSLIEGTNLTKKWRDTLLEKAIRQTALWHKAGFKIPLTIHLSTSDFADQQLAESIQNRLKTCKLSAKYLEIELTEQTCLSNQPQTFTILNQLSAMGIKILIEDFCSGHSSFVYLTRFPIDKIKIDKSFIMNMIKDEKKLKLVKAMINIAKTLKLKTLAMGVNEENIQKLKEMGCNYAQGLHFNQPATAQDLEQLFKTDRAS
ncbi:bifunctional diguanylate cyclase/phosphodiesterase [Legionella israelensis]|uniref:Bifunctional diguanylate cyclase/phosphodiesterase n=1 Tax=Legionella israelensis TaxID=454 RepID=A0AAX1EJD1_9GAMM|nr:bifunctional diguanylate cyclase/phosphodiesterase [Legionella israelensis]QBR84912.1 bifunctional diguanylate cyclase/phosphodiesterase [Legionella israelensis]